MSGQCSDHALLGGRCDLPEGHEGKHRKTYDTHVSEWDAESQARFIKRWEKKR